MVKLWRRLGTRLGDTLGGILAAFRAFSSALQNATPRTAAPAAGTEPPVTGDGQELPASYGRSKITLMVVDPYLVHAYWDIDVTHLPAGTKSAALRFHETGEAASGPSFDVDVDLRAPNWYVHLWSPAKSYYADLGVTTEKGEFIPLAQSNPVETPRAWPAAEIQKPAVRRREPGARSQESGVSALPSAGEDQARAPVPPAASPTATERQPVTTPEPRIPVPQPPSPISAPKPLYADEVLRQKLAEIYALRSWQSRPAAAMTAASTEVFVESNAGSAEPEPVAFDKFWNSNVLTAAPAAITSAAIPADLTAFAEHRFSPGVPSSPPSREILLPT